MTKKLLVRAIAALLLHCQPAIADLLAPHHARLLHPSGHALVAGSVDGLEKDRAFKDG